MVNTSARSLNQPAHILQRGAGLRTDRGRNDAPFDSPRFLTDAMNASIIAGFSNYLNVNGIGLLLTGLRNTSISLGGWTADPQPS
jgi:hypothetical protein